MPVASACRAWTLTRTHTHTHMSNFYSSFYIPRKKTLKLFLCTSLLDSFLLLVKILYRYFESTVSYVYKQHIQSIFRGRVLYMGMHSLALQPHFPLGYFPVHRDETEDFAEPSRWKRNEQGYSHCVAHGAVLLMNEKNWLSWLSNSDYEHFPGLQCVDAMLPRSTVGYAFMCTCTLRDSAAHLCLCVSHPASCFLRVHTPRH